jgi:DNA-binding beta-propeller fold protein YncE
MAARARTRLTPAVFAGAVLAATAGGCGVPFKMPTESRLDRTLAGQGTYQRIATWTGMANIQDILLTPSGELFLLFQDPVARRGQVYKYPQSTPTPIRQLVGSTNATAVCFGGNRVFVLDQGDTSTARTDFPCPYFAEYRADEDTLTIPLHGFSRPIADLAAYWHVREYYLDGRPVLDGNGGVAGFTDTSFAWVSGVAADVAPDGTRRVYVAGVIIYCHVDPFDDHVRTLEFRYRIRRYVPGGGDRFVTDGPWRRDPTYLLTEGTGFGSTRDPRGMQRSDAGGPALYFADRGNNQVQKYADPAGFGFSFKLDIGGSGPDSMLLSQPLDVAVDSAGFVYVVDPQPQAEARYRRVLRYDPEGNFVQRVDWNRGETMTDSLTCPVAAAADNRQVYVADRGAGGRVLRYLRRD